MPQVSRAPAFPAWLLCQLVLLFFSPLDSRSDDTTAFQPLRAIPLAQVVTILPPDTQLLIEQQAIEAFLVELDRKPPDWAIVYGRGHSDPGHDERLFNLNRERDAWRERNPALTRCVAFVWTGELSRFDPEAQAYTVAIGPEYNSTSWGLVRFKPEEFPGDLRVRPDKTLADRINRSFARGEKVSVFVVMIGRLTPNESIIYDFSHDEEGLGLIMPVVRIEQVEVLYRE